MPVAMARPGPTAGISDLRAYIVHVSDYIEELETERDSLLEDGVSPRDAGGIAAGEVQVTLIYHTCMSTPPR